MSTTHDWEKIRSGIVGLGENSVRKNYYPELQSKIKELEIAKEQLVLSEQNIKNFFNSTFDAIFIIDYYGEIIEVNDTLCFLYGVTRDNYKNYSLSEYLVTDKSNEKFLDKVLDGLSHQDTVIMQMQARRPIDNMLFPVELYIKKSSWRGEKTILIAARDITERLKTEMKLMQWQKMDSIGQLAGGIAHDFNNLLAGIIGFAELVQIAGPLSENQKKYVQKIIKASETAGALTKKLLAFSRKNDRIISEIDFIKVINDTIDILSRTINKNIQIEVEDQSQYYIINGDQALLENAIINIGVNASHAMPQGGKLSFSIKNIDFTAQDCRLSSFDIKPGKYLEISIKDTGEGMAPEVVSHIFEPFFTTKERGKGTGLGLSVVYGTIQDHGGAITVYSEKDKGTVFNIYLPVVEQASDQKPVEHDSIIGGGTILLVDDEELVRDVASGLLTSLGYEVITAENGKIGVELFAEFRDKINIIILDMIMPVMGGAEAVKKIREIDSNVPIIIASGFSKEKDIESLNEQNISGFIQKPFRVAEINKLINNIRK